MCFSVLWGMVVVWYGEDSLEKLGYNVGVRLLELLTFREKGQKRELRLLKMLEFVSITMWKALFGRQADSLEKNLEDEDSCTILISSLFFPIGLPFFFPVPFLLRIKECRRNEVEKWGNGHTRGL